MPKSLKLFFVASAVIFAATLYVEMVGTLGLAIRTYYLGATAHASRIEWAVVSAAIFDGLTPGVMLLLAGLAVRPQLRGARTMFVALTVYTVLINLPSDVRLLIETHFDFSSLAQVTVMIGRSEALRFALYVAMALPVLQLGAIALLFTGASRRWFETARPDTSSSDLRATMPLAVKLVAVASLFVVLGWTWGYVGRAAIFDQQNIANTYHSAAYASARLWAVGPLIVKAMVILALGALVVLIRRGWVRWTALAIFGNFALYALFTEGFAVPHMLEMVHHLPGLALYAALTPYVFLAASLLCGIVVFLLLLPGSRAWFARQGE